jgi:hypothetical protein
LVTRPTGDERRNVDFSSIDLDSYRRTIPGLGGKTAAIPRDYSCIVVDVVVVARIHIRLINTNNGQ